MTGRMPPNSTYKSKRDNFANELVKIEMQKGGKFDPKERYKMMLKEKMHQKMQESKRKALGIDADENTTNNPFKRKASASAIKAYEQMMMKETVKRARELRKMVIIKPKNLAYGKVDKKGNIYDTGGFIVGKINAKDGKMTTSMGGYFGMYKNNSATHRKINAEIFKRSPFLHQQRKLLLQKRHEEWLKSMESSNSSWEQTNSGAINIYGHRAPKKNGVWGFGNGNVQQNAPVTGTAWGARSNNIHGTFSGNAWGSMMDNVWGGVESNVWGGIGDGASAWGRGGGWGSHGGGIMGKSVLGVFNRIGKGFGRLAGMFGIRIGSRSVGKAPSGGGAAARNARMAARVGGRR